MPININNQELDKPELGLSQPVYNISFRRHRAAVLGLSERKIMWRTGNLGTEIQVAEESYGLTPGNDGLEPVDWLGRRDNDAMECRMEEVVTSASEEVCGIDDDSARLWRVSHIRSRKEWEKVLTIGGPGANSLVVEF